MLMHIVSVGIGWSLKGIALMLHAGLRVDVKDRNGNTPLLKLLQEYRREFRYYGCPHWFGWQPLNGHLQKTSFTEFITSIQRRTWYTDYNALEKAILEALQPGMSVREAAVRKMWLRSIVGDEKYAELSRKRRLLSYVMSRCRTLSHTSPYLRNPFDSPRCITYNEFQHRVNHKCQYIYPTTNDK